VLLLPFAPGPRVRFFDGSFFRVCVLSSSLEPQIFGRALVLLMSFALEPVRKLLSVCVFVSGIMDACAYSTGAQRLECAWQNVRGECSVPTRLAVSRGQNKPFCMCDKFAEGSWTDQISR
jgi:hypothetical protein